MTFISYNCHRELKRGHKENYSFSGALRPLSKLIVCLVMLRGRHRGLPVAIDRAVMLPKEFKQVDEQFDYGDDGRQEDYTNSAYPNEPFQNRTSSPLLLDENRASSKDSVQRSNGAHNRFRKESSVGRGLEKDTRAELSGTM